MTFTRRLRDGVRRGEITCSVRIWTHPHVKVGGRYRMDEGQIEVDAIQPITFEDITPDLARRSGFQGVLDLLKVAKHGRGERIYLVQFHYLPPTPPVRKRPARPRAGKTPARGAGKTPARGAGKTSARPRVRKTRSTT